MGIAICHTAAPRVVYMNNLWIQKSVIYPVVGWMYLCYKHRNTGGLKRSKANDSHLQ